MSVAAIGIICKAPQPGRSKTRLATAIGAVAASSYPPAFCATSPQPSRRYRGRSAGAATAFMLRRGTEHIMRQLLPAGFGLLLTGWR